VDGNNASLGDFVWWDRDADGIQDCREKGIEGVIVYLLDSNGSVVASTVTDARGYYGFADLASGTYTVEVASTNFAPGGVLAGWQATLQDQGASESKDSDGDPITHKSGPVVLAAGQQSRGIDFGFRAPAGRGECVVKIDWTKRWQTDGAGDRYYGRDSAYDDCRSGEGRQSRLEVAVERTHNSDSPARSRSWLIDWTRDDKTAAEPNVSPYGVAHQTRVADKGRR